MRGNQRNQLTMLRDEGDAAVHRDGDGVLTELLVAQRPAVPPRRPRERHQPQFEVHAVEPMDIHRPATHG